MYNRFIEKIKTALATLPIGTEVSFSISDKSETRFIGLRKDNFGLSLIDNKDTAFEIGSVTKAFTGNILATLVVEHKINLDDRIESLLPFILLGQPPITFRQLGLHTSGLARMPQGYDDRPDFISENPFSNFNEADFIQYFSKELLLESIPGEKATYSNLGFALLSYLISKIENKPFSTSVKEKIINPLGMKNTSFHLEDLCTPFRVGLNKAGHPTPCWEAGLFNGSLGLISTAEDLSKFSRLFFNYDDEAVKIQTKNTFPAKPGIKTCLGLLMVDSNNDDPILKINGGTAGSSSCIVVNQNRQKSFTFCSNIDPDTYMELIEHLCIEAVLPV